MSTIRRIALADFERLLEEWQPRRRITQFHLHCTDRPRRADFRGQATIEAMRAYHMGKGWSDIAQHLTVDPAGGLWTGRSWDVAPASALGHNGTAKAGPFMIEVIGNFDKGLDPFEGTQRQAVLGVIAALLRKAGLDETALFFHRDFTNAKSCPGTSLDRTKMRREVASLLNGNARLSLPSISDAMLGTGEVRGWFANHGARGGDEDDCDPDFAEVPEEEWMLAEQEALAARLDLGPGADGARRAPLPVDAPLRRHTINLSKGLLSTSGDIDSVTVTPRMIVEKHLVDYIETCRLKNLPAHLLFYAHGGLVDEEGAICYARTVLPWWLRNGVFPIFFIWESGLFETLRQTPRGARGLSDLTDRLLEGLTQRVARRVWTEMKDDAGNASEPALPQYQGRSGGAYQLAELLKPVLAKYPEVKLHAVGHSTGPIFLAKFLPLLTRGNHAISTLSYLAPAIRTDCFIADVVPLIGAQKPIRELCMYTMTDEAERDDTCAKIYRKSLLYFVREACDDRNDGRILGLQKDLYGDARLRTLFGLPAKNTGQISASTGPVAVEFSPAPGAAQMNPKTRALQHGGFDNDAETMISVLARVLGVPRMVGSPAMQFPSPAEFRVCGLGDETRAAPLEPDKGDIGGCPCCRRATSGQEGNGISEDGRDGFGDDEEAGGDVEPDDEPAGGARPSLGSSGGRLAVCIGIDAYPDQPLAGCVNDSKRWARALDRLGFRISTLRDEQATRKAMHDALAQLVDGARRGDELVFQYSGHGAQVPDLDGDEEDPFDEVFVPIDYGQGQMLIDDDVRAITRRLPAGATLTLFMDCCHSGTNSRARAHAVAGRSRPRFMTFDDDTVARYLKVRGGPSTSGRGGASDASPGPGVAHFAACLDSEYAWESDGEGDFTRAAMEVFDDRVRKGWSNQQFIDAVIDKLRKPVRQQPRLWNPALGIGKRALLGGA